MGRGREDINGAEIRFIGMVPVPLPCAMDLLLRWSLVFLPFGAHPVVSLQDPLNRVIRLLQATRVGRRMVVVRPSRLSLVPNVLPLGLLPGALQKSFSAVPTLPQVEVDEVTELLP